MKREQEDVEVVAPANARRVHGMTALMKHGQESELGPEHRPGIPSSVLFRFRFGH